MNEITEKNINETIDWLQKTGGAIQDFAAEQMPLYCREVVAYELWLGGVWLFIGVILLLAGIVFFRKALKTDEDNFWFFGVSTGFISALIFACFLFGFVKAIVAPRVVIVEHLRGLVK